MTLISKQNYHTSVLIEVAAWFGLVTYKPLLVI